MKKVSCVLLSAVILTLTACSADGMEMTAETGTTAAELSETETAVETVTAPAINYEAEELRKKIMTEEKNRATEVSETAEVYDDPQITLMILYENDAWGFQQDVTVIDTNGQQYRVQYWDEEDKFDLSSDDWYAELEKLTEEEPWEYHLSGKALEEVRSFSDRYSEFEEYPIIYIAGNGADMGNTYLYGIYRDENGVPEYLELCVSGNGIECMDNSEIKEHVLKLSQYNVIDEDFLYFKDEINEAISDRP